MANILIDLGHGGDVHLFRNAARDWQAQGHTVLFSTLDRDVILGLVKAYNLPYRVTYKRRKGKLALMVEIILRTISTYRIARQFKADLFVSFGSPIPAVVAWLMGKPYIAFTDTEHATEQHALFKPFATVVATPTVFTGDFGAKHVRYAGYHELAYLHPDEFTPDPGVLTPLGLKPDDPFFVVRFVAWDATHDVGQHGFSLDEKRNLLRELSARGQVLLSVEGNIDAEFASFNTNFSPETIHDLLAFAALYIGEGATMASEAAVLGTPSIYVNTLTMGYIFDQRDYGLLFLYPNGRGVVEKVRELLDIPDLKQIFAQRREKMLSEKINVTPWLVDLGNRLLNQEH